MEIEELLYNNKRNDEDILAEMLSTLKSSEKPEQKFSAEQPGNSGDQKTEIAEKKNPAEKANAFGDSKNHNNYRRKKRGPLEATVVQDNISELNPQKKPRKLSKPEIDFNKLFDEDKAMVKRFLAAYKEGLTTFNNRQIYKIKPDPNKLPINDLNEVHSWMRKFYKYPNGWNSVWIPKSEDFLAIPRGSYKTLFDRITEKVAVTNNGVVISNKGVNNAPSISTEEAPKLICSPPTLFFSKERKTEKKNLHFDFAVNSLLTADDGEIAATDKQIAEKNSENNVEWYKIPKTKIMQRARAVQRKSDQSKKDNSRILTPTNDNSGTQSTSNMSYEKK